MGITFDPAKSERNREERGLPFSMVQEFVWSSSLIGLSAKQDVTATRFVAVGLIADLVHVVVFVLEDDDCRIISLRRADRKERKLWHAARTRT